MLAGDSWTSFAGRFGLAVLDPECAGCSFALGVGEVMWVRVDLRCPVHGETAIARKLAEEL